MSEGALRVGAAVLVAMVSVWAGARLYSAHQAARVREALSMPAGESRRSRSRDLEAGALDPLIPPARIPERLPDFSLSDLDGKSVSIKAWSGQSLIINFWATWCAPCRREIPLLETLHADGTLAGPTVIGIAVDHRDSVAAYAKELKINYPVLIGERDALDAAAAFGVVSPVFPFTVFTDRRGAIVALYMGELHQAEAGFILAVVRDLDADKIPLPQARHTIEEGLRALAATHRG